MRLKDRHPAGIQLSVRSFIYLPSLHSSSRQVYLSSLPPTPRRVALYEHGCQGISHELTNQSFNRTSGKSQSLLSPAHVLPSK